MTTIRSFTASLTTAAAAAALALTGVTAPQAAALDFDRLLSISAGDTADYTTTVGTEGTTMDGPVSHHRTTAQPTAQAPDMLTDPEPLAEISNPAGTTAIYPNELYATQAGKIARLINATRAENGEPYMRLDPSMSEGAQRYAEHLAATGVFEHDPSNHKYGEILAKRYNIHADNYCEKTIGQWEKSPHHKRLMHDKRFHVMGVGVAHDPETGAAYAAVRLYYN